MSTIFQRSPICKACPTPCAGQRDLSFRMSLKSVCPLGSWPALMGLGDAVAIVAQPVAHTIDKVLGTDVANCAGCGERQDTWNKVKLPFSGS